MDSIGASGEAGDAPRGGAGDRLAWGLVVVGVVLRLWQYLFNRCLWLDEAWLGNELLESSFGQILGNDLRHDQVVPPLFGAAVKALAVVFGDSERVLRLIPLLCGCAVPCLWMAVCVGRMSARAVRLGVALVSLSPMLIYYSSELKPYSVDAACFLALTALALRSGSGMGRDIGLGILGAVAPWVSFGAVFGLAGAGCLLVAEALRAPADQRAWRFALLATIGALWASSLWLLLGVGLSGVEGMGALKESWSHGFAPVPPLSGRDVMWYPNAASMVGAMTFYEAGPLNRFASIWHPDDFGFALLGVAGATLLVSRERRLGWAWGGALAASLVMSALGKYPFFGRLALYWVPPFAACVAIAADWLAGRFRGRGRRVAFGVLSAGLLAYPVILSGSTVARPHNASDLRAVLGRLAAERVDPGSLWVSRLAEPAFRYYGRYHGFRLAQDRRFGLDEPAGELARRIALTASRKAWLVHSELGGSKKRHRAEAQRLALEAEGYMVTRTIVATGAECWWVEPIATRAE